VLEMANGVLVDIEAAVNISYGYDIRGEILGESGTIELAESSPVIIKRNGLHTGRVPADWRERFIRAYDIELQEWIEAVTAGHSTGPSSWDGYAATVVTDAGIEASRSGQRATVTMREQPQLYRIQVPCTANSKTPVRSAS
jgi:myo-inositol 2-dehydrogenase/D-chiro-inositol 1-dehydrogenase